MASVAFLDVLDEVWKKGDAHVSEVDSRLVHLRLSAWSVNKRSKESSEDEPRILIAAARGRWLI